MSERYDELKARLGLGLLSSHIQLQTTRSKTKIMKPKIGEGTVVQNSAEPGKPPETQNRLPCLKVTLPLKGPRPVSVPEPVNIYQKEDEYVYEADITKNDLILNSTPENRLLHSRIEYDEDEHFLHKRHRPRPGATISPQNTSH